jgi:hypothetical protein
MSAEFQYSGFFNTNAADSMSATLNDSNLKEQFPCIRVDSEVSDNALRFIFSGDDAYYAWEKISPTLEKQYNDCSEYLILATCEEDADIVGRISNENISGYIESNIYFDFLDLVDYDKKALVSLIESKLRNNEIELQERLE